MDVENMSDHHHLCFSYRTGRTTPDNYGDFTTATTACRRRLGWRSAQIDADLLATALIIREWTGVTSPPVSPTTAEWLIGSVTTLCDLALRPRNPHTGRRPPVHWWNDSIAVARADACGGGGCGSDVTDATTMRLSLQRRLNEITTKLERS